jgi:hypothetical protein
MKPSGRSFPSYVIDLRDRFPQTLTACGPRGTETWRERALTLEDELGEAKLEVQKLTLGKFMRIYAPDFSLLQNRAPRKRETRVNYSHQFTDETQKEKIPPGPVRIEAGSK